MGSAGLSPKIKLDNPLAERMVSDIAVAGISSVVRGRFDVENLATQLITDAAAVGMQQRQTKPVSDDYQESQRASRGVGKITQTTIEQQWESQLINDAEFTANAQLPSVTFDVNNEALAQRVGEEVSGFQHVDPPRNPIGFWQRVEQRFKNDFEHRALIAEGRAAANSEVMRESLGYAAVNQQHYLDLGYSESVVQTRAAEWTAATQLPFMIPEIGVSGKIGKGIMQASSLMNRWGVFGHNDRGSAVLFRAGTEGVEPASQKLIQAIQNKGRTVVIAKPGSEEYRYLQFINAEANVGGADMTHILLKENPSKAAVLEEFLHGTQQKLGIIDRIGTQGAEVHVKDFMIRHQKMLDLSQEDINILHILKERDIDLLNQINNPVRRW